MTDRLAGRTEGSDATFLEPSVEEVTDFGRPSPPKPAHEVVPSAADQLECHYRMLEKHWTVEIDQRFAGLVVPSGNSEAPIHRWFHLKEAYSRDLLSTIITTCGLPADGSLSVLDPFAGSGTTLLSGVDLVADDSIRSFQGHGIEVNPFLHAVATAKLTAAINVPQNPMPYFDRVVAAAESTKPSRQSWPSLSTFQNEEYFPAANVDGLVALRRALTTVDGSEAHAQLGRLALSMAVGPASRLRRDGRALRVDVREPTDPFEAFRAAAKVISMDLEQRSTTQRGKADVAVAHASAVAPTWSVPDNSFDLVMFSPPYPNNIDYTEVYKTELWALGFVTTPEAFREQRHRTLRSHPSVKFTRELAYLKGPERVAVNALLSPILKAVPESSRYASQLERLITGYADDMLTVFQRAHAALRPGGTCVYVVGNSVHGTSEHPVVIASDLVLARLAEVAGLSVERIKVARYLPRRRTASEYGRESVVILRKLLDGEN